ATVKIDPLGRVIAILGTTPQGQGHQTIVSQIVASELGVEPRDVTVVDEMDTFTRVWSISSGTYSSRFGSIGTSAVALAARKLKSKLTEYAAHLMGVTPAEVEFRDGGAHRGLGGALYEELAYDDEGQLLSGTFMDYLVPTASEAPDIDIAHVVSPSPLTTLGSKGLGESSSMTVPAVIANAVSDALKPLGIGITELPMTPSRLHALIKNARKTR